MFKNLNGRHKAGPHSELSGVVPHPSTGFHLPGTVPDIIKSLIRPFFATLGPNSTQLRAGLDYQGPGVWRPENMVRNLAILILLTVWASAVHHGFKLPHSSCEERSVAAHL